MIRDSKFRNLIACCALAAAAPGYALAQAPKPAEPMGRLFFTPAQRAQLDVARAQRARTALLTEKTEETAASTPQTITYDGVVRRSDGKSTVFINSRPVNEKDAASGPVIVGRIRADGGVSLQIPQSGRAVNLRPGQSIELLSGTIEERYTRKPVAPEPKVAVKPEAKPAPDVKSVKPATTERARDERDPNEEKQRERLQEAIAEAQRGNAAAKGNNAPISPATQPAR